MMKQIKFIIFILIVLVIVSCYVSNTSNTVEKPISYRHDFASVYNPSNTILHPLIRVYVENKNEAIVYCKISRKHLLLNKKNPLDTLINIGIKYAVRAAPSFEIVDTGVNMLSFNLNMNNEFYETHFKINLKSVDNKLVLGFYGINMRLIYQIIIDVNNQDNLSKERYICEQNNDGYNIMYNNFVNAKNIYRIRSSIYDLSKCTFEYYKFGDDVVLAPYFIEKPDNEFKKPDSIFSYQIGDTVSFVNRGYYVLKPSPENKGILCLLNVSESFPGINKLSDMLDPLELIATSKEMKAIENDDNLKLAVDKFWLTKSNNKKFAREQIRVFYNRVKLANIYFSDYREGWKTDRGILYVVLGPPTIVNINSNGEDWFYGENPNVAGVYFIFEKWKSPLGETVYKLRRDDVYQTIWAQALTTWRNGRIFTITKN